MVLNLVAWPTQLKGAMTPEQRQVYVSLYRIEEISTKLKINDYKAPSAQQERSPSPPPQYDTQGRRTNTRELRYYKKLEDERNGLVQQMMKTVPMFKPPAGYKKPIIEKKVFLPTREYPEVNFVGQLLGPRGNTLKRLQTENNVKIGIRGKGSVKGGRSNEQEEDLHCVVTSESELNVRSAEKLIMKIVDLAVNAPVGENELKRTQLRDLAVLNGTLRVQHDDGRPCPICRMPGHRHWACPMKDQYPRNVIICNFCGGPGHIERDCKVKFNTRISSVDNEINLFVRGLNGEENEDQINYEDDEPLWKKRKENDGSATPVAPKPQPPLVAQPPPPPVVKPPPPPPKLAKPPPPPPKMVKPPPPPAPK